MLHLLQIGPSKVLTTFPIQSQNSWQLSLLELSPCCVPTRNTVTLSSDSCDIYTYTVQSSPSSANAALLPHPRFQTYPPTAHSVSSPSASHHRPLLLAVLLYLLPLLPPNSLRVFQWNAGGLRDRRTDYFTFFCPMLLTLSISRNPILTHLPLSGFLDSLLCILIALTPGLAFSLLMPRTLAAVSSFSSGRACPFLNSLPPLFLCSIPILIM